MCHSFINLILAFVGCPFFHVVLSKQSYALGTGLERIQCTEVNANEL